jgi:drug/metabolite transporter (DMT)-like permease
VIRRHGWQLVVVGLLSSGLPAVLYSFAVIFIPTSLSSILNATTPMFGALVAWFWLQDRPNASRTIGLLVGFAGVALLASGRDGGGPAQDSGLMQVWAILACLLACLCYGIAASFTKIFLSDVPPLATAAGSQLGAALVLAGPALTQLPPRMPSATAWGAALAVGVLCTAWAYVLYFRTIQALGPARAITVPYVIPIFAVFYGIVLLDETLTWRMVGCGLVIALGTALATGLLRLPLGRRSSSAG